MSDSSEILRLRVLLSFLKDDETCNVMGISRTLNTSKQTISRIIISLEKDGLVDRSDLRHPVLTEKGLITAQKYSDKIDLSLNYLMHNGVNIQNAKKDAYLWALYNSEDTIRAIRRKEELYRVKEAMKDQYRFTGSQLCRNLADGEYEVPFFIYREHIHNGSNISMANNGFEHPCILSVKDGIGTIQLKSTSVSAVSASTGKSMLGAIKSLKYFDSGNFIGAENSGSILSFPAGTLNFVNIGEGVGRMFHGTVLMKMLCNAGVIHMPESEAVFTMIL